MSLPSFEGLCAQQGLTRQQMVLACAFVLSQSLVECESAVCDTHVHHMGPVMVLVTGSERVKALFADFQKGPSCN